MNLLEESVMRINNNAWITRCEICWDACKESQRVGHLCVFFSSPCAADTYRYPHAYRKKKLTREREMYGENIRASIIYLS